MNLRLYSFRDYYANKVDFSYDRFPFSKHPRHVWIICRLNDDWLMTKHSSRGIEFPGGKVENGESARQAAVREVYEETGGIVSKLIYIGQYKVTAKEAEVIKDVYFATISHLEKQTHYFETEGPVLISEIPALIKQDPTFSFIMKDDVLKYSIAKVEQMICSKKALD
ncbi:MAG: nucleoside triphosphatase YtkD [Bacillaceae bacterium]|nr:nucleoside triphosphatase YtkD [Bacillaceae bacterium]